MRKLNEEETYINKTCVPFIKSTVVNKTTKNLDTLIPFSNDFDKNVLFFPEPMLEPFLKHYRAENGLSPIVIKKFVFRAKKGFFDRYIDEYTELKIQAKANNDKPLVLYAKLMLNALYGKFGQKRIILGKYFNENNELTLHGVPEESMFKKYLPIACMITAQARATILKAVEDNYDNFIYADTDSVHLIDNGIAPKNLKFHQTKLGY